MLPVDVDFSIFTKDDVRDIDLHKSGTWRSLFGVGISMKMELFPSVRNWVFNE